MNTHIHTRHTSTMPFANNNVCVICQDGICVEQCKDAIVPLPCMHVFHRECLTPYIRMKLASRADIVCPVCREVSFLHNSQEYNEFCASLGIQALPSDVKAVASTGQPHIRINIPEIRPFENQDTTHLQIIVEDKPNNSCCMWFLILLFIAIIIVTIVLVVMFAN